MQDLQVALEKGIDDKEHIDKDTDLDSLRKNKKYQEMMRRYFG